ncbi:MAG: transporter [Paenibacillus sp.]|nr:transporter [Paenibacillus sp.]
MKAMAWAADVKSFFRIKGAAPLVAGMFGYGIGVGILAPMNAVYMRDGIGLSKGEIASVFAIALLLNMATTLSVGFVSDKLARKKTLPMIACALCMTGLAVYMNADGYRLTLLAMILTVAPSGLIMGQLYAMARCHFMKEAAAFYEMAQIWLRTTFSVGFFSGLLIGANVYVLAGFHGILWGNFLGYALLLGMLLMYRERERAAAAQSGKSEPFSAAMLVALLLFTCADALRGLYLPLVVTQLFGRPELMSVLLLFMSLAGYWALKYGSARIIALAGIMAACVYAIYAFRPPLAVFFVVQPLYSFYVSVLYGVGIGFVQRMFQSRIGFGSSLYVRATETAGRLTRHAVRQPNKGRSEHA